MTYFDPDQTEQWSLLRIGCLAIICAAIAVIGVSSLVAVWMGGAHG